MDTAVFEQLLHEEEGSTLDFKREQYRFAKATDDEKSELLKDILGFANAWRRADAYILIGVEEVRGGRSNVVGTNDHLDDHSIQQFVGSLVNRPLRFGYEAFTFEGKQVGIIRIECQSRPFYLKRDFGKLRQNEVYVRRGTSTDPTKPASPDEIAQMGIATESPLHDAELAVEFAEQDREQSLGAELQWDAELWNVTHMDRIPQLGDRETPNALGIDLSAPYGHQQNYNYYREFAQYQFVKRLFRPVRLVISNVGQVAAADVRVELIVPQQQGVTIMGRAEFPQRPQRRASVYEIPAVGNIRPVFRHVGYVEVNKSGDRFKVNIDCGRLQPGRKVWSDVFYVGIRTSTDVPLAGQIFAANLSQPKSFTLTITASISHRAISVEELLSLAKDS